MNHNRPKVTIISTNFNHGRFLRATIESILGQTYDNIQFIVVDGGSTDDSVEILKQYPQIEWISEKDQGSFEAFEKGLKLAKGEYLMQCAVTDGYLDKDWVCKCIEAFQQDSEISLVWGLSRYLSEDGKLMGETYPQFTSEDPPQKNEYFYYWLTTFFWFPEHNFCIKKNVFEDCFRKYVSSEYVVNGKVQFDPWLEFNYLFNSRGYLPFFIRAFASFGRFHSDQKSQAEVRDGVGTIVFDHYNQNCAAYRRAVFFGKKHLYRNPSGQVLPYEFIRQKFIFRHMFSLQFLINSGKPALRPLVKQLMRIRGLESTLRKLKKYS